MPCEPVRRYDPEMIRDFLNHLLWDLRATHFEQVAGNGTVHQELVDQLAAFTQKYHCALLPVIRVDTRGASDEQTHHVVALVRRMYEKSLRDWIHALESLQDILSLAVQCAEHDVRDGNIPTQLIRVVDFLEDEPQDGGMSWQSD